MSQLRTAKVLFKHKGIIRSAFKISFTKKDASIYLFPYGNQKKYHYGGQIFPEKEISHTFNWKDILSESTPKLSIHESGQVHIKSDGICAGPLQTLPLSDFRGEHLASVSLDSLGSCPEHTGNIKNTGRHRHVVLNIGDDVPNVRFILYANGSSPSFRVNCPLVVNMKRSTMQSSLYIGIAPIAQNCLKNENETKKGTTTLAGWNPKLSHKKDMPFLFLRAE